MPAGPELVTPTAQALRCGRGQSSRTSEKAEREVQGESGAEADAYDDPKDPQVGRIGGAQVGLRLVGRLGVIEFAVAHHGAPPSALAIAARIRANGSTALGSPSTKATDARSAPSISAISSSRSSNGVNSWAWAYWL